MLKKRSSIIFNGFLSIKEAIIKKDRYFLCLCIIVSFVLRFYFMLHREVIDFDGAYYAMLGTNLFSGNGYTEAEGYPSIHLITYK